MKSAKQAMLPTRMKKREFAAFIGTALGGLSGGHSLSNFLIRGAVDASPHGGTLSFLATDK